MKWAKKEGKRKGRDSTATHVWSPPKFSAVAAPML